MTTVSGVLPGMFPILTRPFPHEQSASPDRLPIHHLRPLGAARDAVFPARQRLAGAGRAGTEIVVGQHPIERARPRGGVERRHEESGLPGVKEPLVFPPPPPRRLHAAGASGGTRSPISPGYTSSGFPPAADALTGTPSAIASSSACDNPSIREGSAASVEIGREDA